MFHLKAYKCFPPVFVDAGKRRTAALGVCTSTSGRIWAGNGSTSPQATWLTTAWGHARTSGTPKTNIPR